MSKLPEGRGKREGRRGTKRRGRGGTRRGGEGRRWRGKSVTEVEGEKGRHLWSSRTHAVADIFEQVVHSEPCPIDSSTYNMATLHNLCHDRY